MNLDELEANKVEATNLLKENEVEKAVALYESVVASLDKYMLDEKEAAEEEGVRYAQLLLACLNNLSMGYLKMERFDQVIATCTRALDKDKSNLKALYRRAQAHKEKAKGGDESHYSLALLDCEAILITETQNSQAKALKTEVSALKTQAETSKRYPPLPPSDTSKGAVAAPQAAAAASAKIAASVPEEEEQDAHSKNSACSYMNPDWSAAQAEAAAETATAKTGKVASAAPLVTVPPCLSMQDALRAARLKNAAAAGTKKSFVSASALKREEEERLAVSSAVSELQAQEEAAAKKVADTLARKQKVASQRLKGGSKAAAAGASAGGMGEGSCLVSPVTKTGKVKDAWLELLEDEEAKKEKYRKALQSKQLLAAKK